MQTTPDLPVGKRRFDRIVILLVILGFMAVLSAGFAAAVVVSRSQEHARWIYHTFEVERHIGGVRLSLEELRSARRGELLDLAETSGATYAEARASLYREIAEVERRTADNPQQRNNAMRLRVLAGELDRKFRTSSGNSDQFAEQESERQKAAQRVESLAEGMLAIELKLLGQREAAQRSSLRTFYVILGAAGVLLLFVAVMSVLVIFRYTRDLGKTGEKLRTLNADLEGAVKERTRDLQRANDEIQRFAYIVSHDLRAPLVNVMGFTSELEAAAKPLQALVDEVESSAPALLNAEAAVAVRQDLPEALGFIRASTEKMDRLISAILQLSRQGRRTITPEVIDLRVFVDKILDGIRHLIDDRGAQVSVQGDMPKIVTDRLALEQILSNVIENALKYLDPERPGLIYVSAAAQFGRIRIAVKDNGRGIAPKDHERIFELFRRSGQQDQAGEGIGLAHVRALAYRLGGAITVESEPGQGSTFTIDLPWLIQAENGARND